MLEPFSLWDTRGMITGNGVAYVPRTYFRPLLFHILLHEGVCTAIRAESKFHEGG